MPTEHSSTLQEDAYILGPGDVLDLRLFDAIELSGELTVLNDGTVVASGRQRAAEWPDPATGH